MQYEYYYQELPIGERQLYRKICDAVKRHESIVGFSVNGEIDLGRIIRAIDYDHPEIYYWNCQKIKIKRQGNDMALKLDYYWEASDIDKNKPRLEKGIQSILSKCNSQFDSEYDRFLCIYDCMARNIRYDFEKVDSQRNEDRAYSHTVLGVFAKQQAVCEGISKSFKLALERAGIDCIVVCGKKKGDASNNLHAWNVVWIDDKPCYVDLTWAVENSDKNKVNHDYVGLTEEQITKDHSIDKTLDVPACEDSSLDFYVRNNAVIHSEKELANYLKKNANKKPFEINVRLDFKCNISEMAQKASDFVITHFVAKGQYVDINVSSGYREGQNILILVGK